MVLETVEEGAYWISSIRGLQDSGRRKKEEEVLKNVEGIFAFHPS